MLRRFVCAAFLLGLFVSITLAEEIRAVITKVEGGKITFAATKKGEKGPEQTLSVADNVKVLKGNYNKDTKKVEPGEPIAGGLKNEMFSKIDEKGMRATVITDDTTKKITEIRVGGRRGKKNQ